MGGECCAFCGDPAKFDSEMGCNVHSENGVPLLINGEFSCSLDDYYEMQFEDIGNHA